MRRLVAVAAVATAVAVAQRRGLLSHPSPDLLLVLLPALALVIECLLPPARSGWRLGVASAIVFGSVSALMVIDPIANDFVPFFYILLCALAGAFHPAATSVAVLVAAVTLPLVLDATTGSHAPATIAIGSGFAWAVAVAMRSRQHVLDQLKATQRQLLERAADDERRRIAREIHDLLAHTLSVTMLHLTGARFALEEGQTDQAVESLRQAEAGGREAMREVRNTVGLLGDSEQSVKAIPGAADIVGLVSEYEAAGMKATLHVDGELDRITRDTGLTAYRIVQESLANAAKHAPGSSVCVDLATRSDAVSIAIVNARRGPSLVPTGGRGIPGMSERAALVGGIVIAGPVGDRWEVHAELPTASP